MNLYIRFETVGSGKDVLHPLQKHLLRTQESSKLRTLHAINQTSGIHASIRGVFRWLWINGRNFSILNLGASRAVFSSASLVDLGPVSTLVARTKFGMNRDNISIVQVSAQWGLEVIRLGNSMSLPVSY